MALSILQSQAFSVVGGTTFTVTPTNNLTAGSALVAACYSTDGTTTVFRITAVSDATNGSWGVAKVKRETAFDGDIYIFGFTNNASNAKPVITFTVGTGTTHHYGGVLFEVGGADTTNAFATTGTVSNGFAGPPQDVRVGSMTFAVTTDMIIGLAFDISDDANPWTPDVGYTRVAYSTVNTQQGAIYSTVAITPGTINPGFTSVLGAFSSIGVDVAIKPGSSASLPGDDDPPMRWTPSPVVLFPPATQSVDEIGYAGIFDGEPGTDARPPLVVLPQPPWTPPDDSWFDSAIEDDGVIYPPRAPVVFPFAAPTSPASDETWLASAVEDDSFRYPAPAPTTYPLGPATSPAADETWLASMVEEYDVRCPEPAPTTYPRGPETSPGADETWTASSVEDECFRWPAPAQVLYAYAPPAPGPDELVSQPGVFGLEEYDVIWPPPAPITHAIGPETSPASDEGWLASAVEDDTFRFPLPAPIAYAYPPGTSPGADDTWLAAAVDDLDILAPLPAPIMRPWWTPGTTDEASISTGTEDDGVRWPAPAPASYAYGPPASPAADETWLASAVEDLDIGFPPPPPVLYRRGPEQPSGTDELRFADISALDDDSQQRLYWPPLCVPSWCWYSVEDDGIPHGGTGGRVFATASQRIYPDASAGQQRGVVGTASATRTRGIVGDQ